VHTYLVLDTFFLNFKIKPLQGNFAEYRKLPFNDWWELVGYLLPDREEYPIEEYYHEEGRDSIFGFFYNPFIA